jgi:hypothetical protein
MSKITIIIVPESWFHVWHSDNPSKSAVYIQIYTTRVDCSLRFSCLSCINITCRRGRNRQAFAPTHPSQHECYYVSMASTRTTRFAQVQSWTRCRLPIEKPLPCLIDKYREDVGGWRVSLSLLVAAPGYYDSICGRNINDPEEVLFITGKSHILLFPSSSY